MQILFADSTVWQSDTTSISGILGEGAVLQLLHYSTDSLHEPSPMFESAGSLAARCAGGVLFGDKH